ncbi:hypothetical protein [Sphingobium nicotianae]|uniref:DUF8021 domain-containing protein n=1 Tax=Sphingobium nicotianae TaxID=2782607 RepID=A0A9X1ISX0_9SPHN|nr:hypothetical protein [Sphingobium nicotianae]MBT2189016.1 hypothetical protein [Sphingobium nicotianae]
MKRQIVLAMTALGLAGLSAPAAAQGKCDRKCLAGKLDQFLNAVVAHDPAKANLWVGFRQTQNAVLLHQGDGIWKSNTGIGPIDRRYYDADTSQAEFFGTVRESDKMAVVSLRLKIGQGGQVTEAEWHIARAADPGIMGEGSKATFDVDNLVAHPPAQRTVPVAQRATREQLIAAVNSYFDGIVAQTGRHVQANDGCMRFENGMGGQEWNRKPAPPADADFQSHTDCRSGYASLNIVNVAARRYLMVDVEAQVVMASAVFMREPLNPKRRNCFMEVFYLDGGKISSVYAAMTYADARIPLPNWEPYEGNFPTGQSLINAR